MLPLRELLQGRQSVPPCAAFAPVAADFAMPSGFAVGKVPGLVLCHVLRSESGAQLVTYWTSSTDARVSWPALAAHLGLSVQPAMSAVTEARCEPRSWLARVRLGTWLLSVAALLGALTVIRDHFGEWLESVELGVTHADTLALDVLESNPLAVPVRLLNRGRVARTSILSAAFALERKGKPDRTSLDVNLAGLAALAPGEGADLLLRGTTPPHTAGAAPQEWLLAGTLVASSGLFSPRKTIAAPARALHNWPRIALEVPQPRPGCTRTCLFNGKIYVGAARDRLSGHVTLTHDRAELTQLSLDNALEPRVGVREGDAPVTKISWQTGPVKAFSTLTYSFHIASTDDQPLSENEWRTLKLVLEPKPR